MRKDFCIFIISYNRANNVLTYRFLEERECLIPIYILIDDDDPTISDYRARFGDKLIIVDKLTATNMSDDFDNFGRHAVLHARNMCFDIARSLGFEYFLQLDDDYDDFYIRMPRTNPDGEVEWKAKQVTKNTLNKLLLVSLSLYIESGATSIAFSQGGDWLGGNCKMHPRKCMNSFFCSVNRPFRFIGRANEDVNSYVLHGSRGMLFLNIAIIQVNQKATQKNKGGTTDVYLDEGTYVKSFYSVLCAPSCINITPMGSSNRRFHHRINWSTAVPYILSAKYRKEIERPELYSGASERN